MMHSKTAGVTEDKARATALAVAKSDEVATKAELYKALLIQGLAIISINVAMLGGVIALLIYLIK